MCEPLCECGTLVAPLTDVIDSDIGPGVLGLCSRCDRRKLFSECVVCPLCISSLFCSKECMQQDAESHAAECESERANALKFMSMAKRLGVFPFVFGVPPPGDDRGFFPVPYHLAVRLPLLPTTILADIDTEWVRTLFENNALCRRLALREVVLSDLGVVYPVSARRG